MIETKSNNSSNKFNNKRQYIIYNRTAHLVRAARIYKLTTSTNKVVVIKFINFN
jgi:hypothetical protein